MLDAFFAVAVPLVVISLIVAKILLRQGNPYQGPEGEAKRDAINKRYGVNKSCIIITIIMVLFYALVVASLFDRWGNVLLSYAISVLLLIPFGTVTVCLFLLYTPIVHAIGNVKAR